MYLLGSVNKTWSDASYKGLKFVKQPPSNKELLEWRKQGYMHTSMTGSMYDNSNTMPNWVYEISSNFDLKNKTYTIYKMNTLEIMPAHIDHFTRYCEIFKVPKNKVKRAVVFLEDWRPGHYFEVNKKGIVNWKAGDYCIWENYVEHAASNIGIEPRYTLQITGHV